MGPAHKLSITPAYAFLKVAGAVRLCPMAPAAHVVHIQTLANLRGSELDRTAGFVVFLLLFFSLTSF